MADTSTIPNEAETRALHVIASEARQSRLCAADSGLPRRFAPRNDGGCVMADVVSIPNKQETPALFVIPAKAGIHEHLVSGVRGNGVANSVRSEFMDSRLRGNDEVL